MLIKFRTKREAIKGAEIVNKHGIYCEYDGYYNIIAFKSSKEEDQAYKILQKELKEWE